MNFFASMIRIFASKKNPSRLIYFLGFHSRDIMSNRFFQVYQFIHNITTLVFPFGNIFQLVILFVPDSFEH